MSDATSLEAAIDDFDKLANRIADERNKFKATLERIANWKTFRGWSREHDADYDDAADHSLMQHQYETGANDAINTLAAIAREALGTPRDDDRS